MTTLADKQAMLLGLLPFFFLAFSGCAEGFLAPTPHNLIRVNHPKTAGFVLHSNRISAWRKCNKAVLQMTTTPLKQDVATLKQDLLNLCVQSKNGLVPFDSSSKQQFEGIVS